MKVSTAIKKLIDGEAVLRLVDKSYFKLRKVPYKNKRELFIRNAKTGKWSKYRATLGAFRITNRYYQFTISDFYNSRDKK